MFPRALQSLPAGPGARRDALFAWREEVVEFRRKHEKTAVDRSPEVTQHEHTRDHRETRPSTCTPRRLSCVQRGSRVLCALPSESQELALNPPKSRQQEVAENNNFIACDWFWLVDSQISGQCVFGGFR